MSNHTYAGHWERPEWIYDQVRKAEVLVKTPEMVALKERSLPLFQQHMAKQFPEFFQHYTKIFFRVINGKLNGQLFLMYGQSPGRGWLIAGAGRPAPGTAQGGSAGVVLVA